MQLIDLSREIYHKMPRLVNHPSIVVTEYSNHDEVREADGYKFSSATLNLSLGDHAGTHVDAPCHFDSSSEALSIDQMPLDNFFTDIHKYFRFLEEVIILTLNDFGIKGERNPGKTGVWLDCDTPFPRKICAMGVRASRWVTMHGFALNVNVDLKYFDNIIPCGIENNSVTSLNVELGIEKVDIGKVKKKILKNFRKLFDATIIH